MTRNLYIVLLTYSTSQTFTDSVRDRGSFLLCHTQFLPRVSRTSDLPFSRFGPRTQYGSIGRPCGSTRRPSTLSPRVPSCTKDFPWVLPTIHVSLGNLGRLGPPSVEVRRPDLILRLPRRPRRRVHVAEMRREDPDSRQERTSGTRDRFYRFRFFPTAFIKTGLLHQ